MGVVELVLWCWKGFNCAILPYCFIVLLLLDAFLDVIIRLSASSNNIAIKQYSNLFNSLSTHIYILLHLGFVEVWYLSLIHI